MFDVTYKLLNNKTDLKKDYFNTFPVKVCQLIVIGSSSEKTVDSLSGL